MKSGEPGAGGNTTPNIPTRNVAGAGEEPRFVGPPCGEPGCGCGGFEGEAGDLCAARGTGAVSPCGHPLSSHL